MMTVPIQSNNVSENKTNQNIQEPVSFLDTGF